MYMNTLLKGLLSAFLLSLTSTVMAHAVWIERDSKSIYLYYGEYDEAKHEPSPGRLDNIGTPQVFVQGQLVSGKKASNAWLYHNTGKALAIRAEAIESPVRDWRKQGIGIVKPLFYARYADSPAAQTPEAELDLVPTGKAGEFQVFVKKQALAATKVVVVAPNGWMREIKTNADGRIEVDMPWRGVYVMEATHVLPEAGEYNGVAYEGRRLRATLAYRQVKGLATFSPAADKPKAY